MASGSQEVSDYDFMVGEKYDFHLNTGIVFIGAKYKGGSPIDGLLIIVPGNPEMPVFIKPEEYEWAEDHDPDRPMTDIFK